MRIASRKNAIASRPNGRPNTLPNLPMRPGHSSPSSNDRTVPVTAPTANVTAMTFDQRRARSSATSSRLRTPRQFAMSVIVGSATPIGTRRIWNASVNAICSRAASSVEDASDARIVRFTIALPESFEQVLAHAQGVGDDRQRRVHRADGYEEARVEDVEVVELVGLAVDVEHRRLGIAPEPGRPRLMRGRGDGHALVEVHVAPVRVLVEAEVAQHRFELLAEPFQRLGVVLVVEGEARDAVVV